MDFSVQGRAQEMLLISPSMTSTKLAKSINQVFTQSDCPILITHTCTSKNFYSFVSVFPLGHYPRFLFFFTKCYSQIDITVASEYCLVSLPDLPIYVCLPTCHIQFRPHVTAQGSLSFQYLKFNLLICKANCVSMGSLQVSEAYRTWQNK